MGDRCWLNISFARKDLEKFTEVLKNEVYDGAFWDEENGTEEEVFAIIYEANYGWYDQLQSLAKERLTFAAEHGAGSDYGPCAYACYLGEMIDVSTDMDSTPTVSVSKNGINGAELSNVKKYYEILDKKKGGDPDGGNF